MLKNLFKTKKICNHHFTEKVGLFYKEHLSQYRNCFDNVEVFIRYQCCKCGEYKDVLLGHQQFCPEMFYDDIEKKQYIKKIRSQGFVMEYELMLREFKKE